MSFKPIEFINDTLILIDQRYVPVKEDYVHVSNLKECHEAIKVMVTRGAPLIGFTTIFGMALWVKNNPDFNQSDLDKAVDFIKTARPTAVNLSYEADRCRDLLISPENKNEGYKRLVEFGRSEIAKLEKDNTYMAQLALEDLDRRLGKKKYRVLTHCNTGKLACGCLGTALGVISYMNSEDRIEHVYADETRPYLQGSRLTAFELGQEDIPHEIVVEGAASYLMEHGLVDAIFVGADRIVANGDTANKIGTATLAIVANYYNVPMYTVAPSSSFDLSLKSGDKIEIEMRDENEILNYKDTQIAPKNSRAMNPSFDVTPGKLLTGIVCEKGLISNHTEKLISW